MGEAVKKIRVLVVDDSASIREAIIAMLSADPAFEIAGVALNGRQAVEFLKKNTVDIVTMDVAMPVLNGLDATREIMQATPVPVVIASSAFHPADASQTLRALQAGAVAVAEKPVPLGSPEYAQVAARFLQTLKLLAEIPVVKRFGAPRHPAGPTMRRVSLIAIGTSTGGPAVVEKILSSLRRPFSIPILLVQHIAEGFLAGYCDWLNTTATVTVVLPVEGTAPAPGFCYVAPEGKHLTIKNGVFSYLDSPEEHNSKPSVSVLFRSLAASVPSATLAVLLTGMGKDGAAELKLLRERGALTVAQDSGTAVVFGMPGEAVRINAAEFTLTPDQIIALMNELSFAGEAATTSTV